MFEMAREDEALTEREHEHEGRSAAEQLELHPRGFGEIEGDPEVQEAHEEEEADPNQVPSRTQLRSGISIWPCVMLRIEVCA